MGSGTPGGSGTPVVVNTPAELKSALSAPGSRIIHLRTDITMTPDNAGRLFVTSNKTLLGSCGATITNANIQIENADNVIIRNVRLVGRNCADATVTSPEVDCQTGRDTVSIRTSTHVWVDHCTIMDGSDGNLDIVDNSDLVTVSFNKFKYSGFRDGPENGHRRSTLVTNTNTFNTRVTFRHNFWSVNVERRMPEVKYATVHLFNNYFEPTSNDPVDNPQLYAVSIGDKAIVRSERNSFRNTNLPYRLSESPELPSYVHMSGDLYTNCVHGPYPTGTVPAGTIPYAYSLDSTSEVEGIVTQQAGNR